MNKFESRHVSIWIEDGILMSDYKKNTVIDLEAAKEIVSDRLRITENISYPILIDFSNIKSVTKQARDYMNSHDGGLKGLTCGAFIGGNSLATLFINLYIKINQPTIPTKFFTNRHEAIEWLKKLQNEKVVIQTNKP